MKNVLTHSYKHFCGSRLCLMISKKENCNNHLSLLPELLLNRALHYAPGLQVDLWSRVPLLALVHLVPPIGPKIKQLRHKQGHSHRAWCRSGHEVSSPLGPADRQHLEILDSRELPAT